jgi:hypothetical protein
MFAKNQPSNSSQAHHANLLSAAQDYLARGWSCIPLREKRPAIPSWKEFQARPPTSDEIRHWFFNQGACPSGVGIGVVTGKVSGLVVVDCDSQKDTEYWLHNFPRSPLMVQTGGGGLHIYYKMADGEEIHNRVKLEGRKIDIRGEGGYVAAPPSKHTSGQSYTWEKQDLSTPLPSFEKAWLADSGPILSFPARSETRVIRNAVAYIRRIHAVSGEGGHNATFRAACKLRDAGLSQGEALAVLADWNETNASPPWSARELFHKVHSAYAAEN